MKSKVTLGIANKLNFSFQNHGLVENDPIVTENVVLETSHVPRVSTMIPTSKASTLLQVFGGSSPECSGREVRLVWAPKIANFAVARSIQILFEVLGAVFVLCFEVQTPLCCGESNWVRRKSRLGWWRRFTKRTVSLNEVLWPWCISFCDFPDLVRLW